MDRLEHRVGRARCCHGLLQKAVVEERGKAADCRGDDRLRRLERATATEDGEVQQVVELVFVEETDAPFEGPAKGLLPRRQVAGPSR